VAVAAQVVKGNRDICILDLERGVLDRLTTDKGNDGVALWAPDGQKIVFSSIRPIYSILQKKADGTGGVEPLFATPRYVLFPYSWSNDRKKLILGKLSFGNKIQSDIASLSMEGDVNLTPLLHGESSESQPQVSPDGRWIAYSSDEADPDKGSEVYVRPFPKVDNGRWQVSIGGGNSPRWSPDGRVLYYLIGREIAEAVVAVKLETEPVFKPDKPEVLFKGNYVGTFPGNGIPWDIHPDGDRFLMMKEGEKKKSESVSEASVGSESVEDRPLKINIIVNWLEELKERVPVE
jgi:hypothetical protein